MALKTIFDNPEMQGTVEEVAGKLGVDLGEVLKSTRFSFEEKLEKVEEYKDKNTEIHENILEKYQGFGKPDEKQIEELKKLSDEELIKMKEIGLKYNNEIKGQETIEFMIDGEKIVMDKVQPVCGLLYWRLSMRAINKVQRRPVEKELLKKIIKIFKLKAELIGLKNYNEYWGYDEKLDVWGNLQNSTFGNFIKASIEISRNAQNTKHTICIHI